MGTWGEIRGSSSSKAMAGHRRAPVSSGEKMRRAFNMQLSSEGIYSHPPASVSVVAICKLGVRISRALESPDPVRGVGLEASCSGQPREEPGTRACRSGTSSVGRVGCNGDAERDTGRENVNQLQCLPERSQM